MHQLFNSIDPSPYRDRDLDRNAEEFIVGWAKELSRNTPFGLLVHLDRSPGAPGDVEVLRDAVHEFFRNRFFMIGTLVSRRWTGAGLGGFAREGLLIGGWVAMWRPLEIFLYDWWPIHAEARLFDRLATTPVRIEYHVGESSEARHHDWPASRERERNTDERPR